MGAKKSTAKSMSKKELIKALENEPLFPGTWINKRLKPGQTCAVCAVGSVVRTKLHASEKSALGDEMYTPSFNDAAEDLAGTFYCASDFDTALENNGKKVAKAFEAVINERGCWSALSSYFEYLGRTLSGVQESVESSSDFSKEEKDILNQALVLQCRTEVVPQLIKMVNKYFPDRIPLTKGAN